jgi:type I restriction enzyme S subunit
MTIITVDVVRRVIERLPPGGFTFDDLRGQVSADYEMLKDIVFELLKDPTSGLKQVFDEESRQMRFLRAKP